ncbi:SDR family oxidoreductase [Photobacterium minamisatsumaniensis]|uniref:SDR family oxidoreductase n=1 Tax=Photobacterium minamisatsumaniensis TaxID=2910233 RepID=UPI003D105AFB
METIVITGANRGIGLELTKQFLHLGWHVIATCRDKSKADQLNMLTSRGKLSTHSLELTNESDVVEFCTALSGVTVDVLINNAGVLGGDNQSANNMDYNEWLKTFAVNTLAPFHLATSLKGNLQQSSRPRIVSISSGMASLSGQSIGTYAYRSSKAALNKVMQVLANEYKQDGIIVCPVNPGWVRTDMGGKGADISVEESAAGLVALINGLTLDHSGRFLSWDGEELSW